MSFTDFGGEMQSRPVTMSSLDIAAVIGRRHNEVTAVIRELLADGVLQNFGKTRPYQPEGGGRPTELFDLNRRDAIIVTARLDNKFLAAVVDRLDALEAKRVARAGEELARLSSAALNAERRRQHTAAIRVYKWAHELAEGNWDDADDCAKAGERAARLATGVDIRDLLGLPPRPEAVGTATGGDGVERASSPAPGDAGSGASSLPPGGAIPQPLDQLFREIHDPADDKLASLASIFAAQLAEGDETPDAETAALLALLADQPDDDEAETDE